QIKKVILPKENEPDLEDVPKEAREAIEFVLVESVDEVLATALDGPALVAPLAPAGSGRQAAMPA
ncbi:MAG: Lon protease C-terminal proteolytic domain, partial [Gaiellaceae bacterium]|nr:Lon protease C-terminal proteolytic domain [Gaiellaceae bacterium]